jgi:glycosyltransferase involved in cell wall biosynthesis
MNILYLTQIFSASRGGGPLIFYDLAKTLSDRGNNVHIICNLSTETGNDRLVIHKVKPFLEESNYLPTSVRENLTYIVNSLIHGISIIDTYKIDVIHTNSFIPVIAGSILGRIKNIPVIATVYDIFTENESGGWKKWAEYNRLPYFYSYLGKIMEKISLSMPLNLIHTISKSTLEDILKIKPNSKVNVVYPSVNVENFNDPEVIEYEKFVLYIGRLVFYKKVDILIEAFRSVVLEQSDAKLIVIGDGPMGDEWKKLTADYQLSANILFLGNVSNIEKIKLLSNCSCLALPSIFEGFGLVILESFIMKKPVLVPNVKPFDEIVDDGIDGFILPHDDSLAWANKIKVLLKNKDLCKAMGENGRSKYIRKFEFFDSINNIEKLYYELIKNSLNK